MLIEHGEIFGVTVPEVLKPLPSNINYNDKAQIQKLQETCKAKIEAYFRRNGRWNPSRIVRLPEPKHLIDKLAEDLWTKVDIEEERLMSNDELLADLERSNPQLDGKPDPKTGSSPSTK